MAGAIMMNASSVVPRQRPRSVLEDITPNGTPNAPNSGTLGNTNPIQPQNNTARQQNGLAPRLGATSSLAASRPAQQQQGFANQTAQPAQPAVPATNAGLGQQVTDAYSLLVGGRNAAADQADRTAMSSLGNLQKASDTSFAREAATLGLAPGSAAYNAAKLRAQTPLLSQGSNILATLAQKRLDDQARTLSQAGGFAQSGQRLASDLEQRGVDNAFRENRAAADDLRFDKTFGSSEDQRAKDNQFRDTSFGASEDQRAQDNAYRTQVLGNTEDQRSRDNEFRNLEFGSQERQRAVDNAFRDVAFNSQEDQRSQDNVYRNLVLGNSEDQRAKDNQFRDNTATQNQLASLLANPDILSAAQLGEVKNAVAAKTGLNFGGLAADPNSAQAAYQQMVDWYTAMGMAPDAAASRAREMMVKIDPYNTLATANSETLADSPAAGSGTSGGDKNIVERWGAALTPTGSWSTDDTAKQWAAGLGNVADGNWLTGAGQVAGAAVAMPGNLARDIGHVGMEGARAVGDATSDAVDWVKKSKVNPANWF